MGPIALLARGCEFRQPRKASVGPRETRPRSADTKRKAVTQTMTSYRKLSRDIKEMLENEYLSNQSDVKKEEFGYKVANGKQVLDKVGSIFEDLERRKVYRNQMSERDKAYKEAASIEIKGNHSERRAKCAQSAEAGKKYTEFLFARNPRDFTLSEKNTNLSQIKRHMDLGDKAYSDIAQSNGKFLGMMRDKALRPTDSMVRTVLGELLGAIAALIRQQCALYKREVSLGNQFKDFVSGFLRSNLVKANSKLGLAAVKTLAAALQDGGRPRKWASGAEKSGEDLLEYLDTLDSHLAKRRSDAEQLEEIVAMIEEIVNELKAGEFAAPESVTLRPGEKSDQPASQPKRMSFMTRLMGKGRGKRD